MSGPRSKSYGRGTHHFVKVLTPALRAQAAAGRPCCRCGHRIDVTLRNPNPASFSVDHYPHSLAARPDLGEDPTNLAPAHLICNQSKGERQPAQTATTNPSRTW